MKVAIKISQAHKVSENEMETNFGAKRVAIVEYETKLAEQLNEIVYEFDINQERKLWEYLEECSITPRIFN